MALYRQTVLDAFEQVADSLHALNHDAETLLAENDALAAAKQGPRLVRRLRLRPSVADGGAKNGAISPPALRLM
jgi:hypothetical protein